MTYFVDSSNTIKNYNYCENGFLPHDVIIPLNENSKCEYKSLVKTGDTVKEGEILGFCANKEDTVNIHSSIPGTVSGIIPCIFANGFQGFGVKIAIGGKFSYLGKIIKPKEYSSSDLKSEKIADQLKKNGVLNTFNLRKIEGLSYQLENKKNAKYVVARLFDEDNFRITDSLNTKFYLNEIVEAIKILCKTINADGALMAIDQKCQIKEEVKKCESDSLKVIEMNIKRYPNGTEREILSAYNRNYKKSYKMNVSKDDLFIDSTTLLDVYKAVFLETPVISKNIYFSGNCLNATSFLNVRTGTTIRDAVKMLGGFTKEPSMIVVNGIISGSSVHSLDAPISKTVKSISFISKTHRNNEKIYNCINCGNCRFVCPKKISPDIIYKNISNFKNVPEIAEKASLACTNCGLCNTVCPSRLPLCQTINALKEKLSIKEQAVQD